MDSMIIYLHGFNSGFDPNASKVIALETIAPVRGMTVNYLDPFEVVKLDQYISDMDAVFEGEVILAGTSLGGYFARYFAKKYKLRCILFNPSIHPWLTLLQYAVENTGHSIRNYFTGEDLTVHTSDVLRLVDYNTVGPTGSGCLTLLATDDELLDYRDAEKALSDFGGSAEIILTTGGHRLSDINRHITALTMFVNSVPVSKNEAIDDSTD